MIKKLQKERDILICMAVDAEMISFRDANDLDSDEDPNNWGFYFYHTGELLLEGDIETWGKGKEYLIREKETLNQTPEYDNKPELICPECGKGLSRENSRCCGMVYGRRGWRQLGMYDG